MKAISNKDYHKARQLLANLARRPSGNLRDCNARREARLLLCKWERNSKEII